MQNTESVKSDLTTGIQQSATMLLVLGILAIIAGFLSLIWPWASGIGVTLVVGVSLMVAGVARLIGAFSMGSFGRGALVFIGGALTLLAGFVLVFRPGIGLASLTLVLSVYLLMDGTFGTVMAFQVRPKKGWGWILTSAIMSALLGILLIVEWPLSGLWAIGTLVGINLIFAGMAMISSRSLLRATPGSAG